MALQTVLHCEKNPTLRFIINGGVKINGGGVKNFEKLINRGGRNKQGGVRTKYKRKETKIELSL